MAKKMKTVELVAKKEYEARHELRADVVANESIRIYGRVRVGSQSTGRMEVKVHESAPSWCVWRREAAVAALGRLSSEDRAALCGLLFEAIRNDDGAARAMLADFVVDKMDAPNGRAWNGMFYAGDETEPVWRHVDRTFVMGENVEWGSYNLTYYAPITAISDKTVTVETGRNFGRPTVKRLDLYRFASLNWDFDLAETRRENAAESMCL